MNYIWLFCWYLFWRIFPSKICLAYCEISCSNEYTNDGHWRTQTWFSAPAHWWNENPAFFNWYFFRRWLIVSSNLHDIAPLSWSVVLLQHTLCFLLFSVANDISNEMDHTLFDAIYGVLFVLIIMKFFCCVLFNF